MQTLDRDDQASQQLSSIFPKELTKRSHFQGGWERNEIQGKSGGPRSMSTGNTYCFPISPIEVIEENKD